MKSLRLMIACMALLGATPSMADLRAVTRSSANGTVTSFSCVTANGVSCSVANATTTPAATFTLGAITPTTVVASGGLTSGANSGTIGSLTLNGSTSGSVLLQPAAAAGTGTIFQLPATNGSNTNVLQTDGSGVTSWVAKSSGTVSSVTFTGDGVVLSSTPSSAVTTTGTVTAALATATAKTVLGNATAGTASPTYTTAPVVSGASTAASFNATDVTTGYQMNGANLAVYPSGDSGTAGSSMGIGVSALSTETAAGSAAYHNTAVGYQAIGTGTMTTAAVDNTAFGYQAGKAITSGSQNTVFGSGAGVAITSSIKNTAFGYQALNSMSNSTGDTAVGYQALKVNTGGANVAIGDSSCVALSSGSGNVCIGTNVASAATGDSRSVFIGQNAGQFVRTNSSTGNTTAIGYAAMSGSIGSATSGVSNTAIGANAMTVCQGVCATNTAIGANAGLTLTTGASNVIIGANVASTTLTTGSGNILIGNSSVIDAASSSTSNTLIIGNNATTPVISSTAINSTPATTLNGTVALAGITTDATHTDTSICQDTTTHIVYSGSGTLGVCLGTSSLRYKNNVTGMSDGLDQILALHPVNFFYKPGHGDNGSNQQYGFLAEDVVHVLPKLVRSDRQGAPNTVDILGMVPIMIKAMKEQQDEINDLKYKVGYPQESLWHHLRRSIGL